MASVTSLVTATTNPGKIREIQHEWKVGGIADIDILSLSNFPGYQSPAEDQTSFMGNAIIKAVAAARYSGAYALADDSGLSVTTLGGAPGVHSARFAGVDASDEQNNAKLVAELRRLPQSTHPAAYLCAIAIASPEAVLAVFTGRFDGEIILSPRGNGGFGYDPYFFIPHLDCTAAELTIQQKSQLSHRGCALRATIDWLRENASRLS